MAKRKKFQGLLTAGNLNLTTSETWIAEARERAKAQNHPENTIEWLKVKNLDEGEVEILIYGEITPYAWESADKSALDLLQELRNTSAERIHLRINSPGGSVFEAVAMFNLLKETQAEIIVHIDGTAASCAGWVAMCGDRIEMGEAARLMIHRATMMTWGDAEELRKDAELMESLEDSILKIFENKTGLPKEELRAMMNAETYLTPEEALEKGFIDSIAGAEDEPKNKAKTPINQSKGTGKGDGQPDPQKTSDGEEPDEKVSQMKMRLRAIELRERELTNQ